MNRLLRVNLRADLAVINGPETVESKSFLIAKNMLAKLFFPISYSTNGDDTYYSQILSISFQSWLPTQ